MRVVLLLIFLLFIVFYTSPSATYAITMGELNILSTDDSGNANLLIAQSATLTAQATTVSISFYITTAAGNLRLGIYDATGPSGGPGTKVAETVEFTPNTGWNTQNVITPQQLAAGTYWIAYLPNNNGLHFVKAVDGTSSGKYYSFTYGTLPTTFSVSPSSTTSHWSLYTTLNPTTSTGSVSLRWDAPTTNVDDTPLTDLAGFKIYWGTATGVYTDFVDAGMTLCYVLSGLTSGLTYYFVATAYNISANESSYSNEVNKAISSGDIGSCGGLGLHFNEWHKYNKTGVFNGGFQ